MTAKKIKTKSAGKNPWKVATIPVHYWITFWALVLATMALATVCFSYAFRPIDSDVDPETLAAFQAIRENLEKQVEELQGEVALAPSPTGFLGEACLQDSISPIDNYLTYVEPQSKVQMRLPFGTGWENENCAFPPARISGNIISFGPVVKGAGEGVRDSMLTIQPAKSTVDFNTEIAQIRSDGSDTQISAIKQRNINGLNVFSYTTTIPTGYVTHDWYALGKTFSYKLEANEWLTDAEAVKIIQSLKVVK